MDILSLAIGFVVGGFTGAAGTFYGNKYTDQRRQKESEKKAVEQWEGLKEKFPEIIREMIEDVQNPIFAGARTFFVLESNYQISTDEPCFIYHPDKHPELLAALRYMEDLGYIKDITPKNCPKYRFYEHFYDLLKDS
ncbi:hypothetical protein [Pseudoalteromonas luteoviolacea]|uniref:Uncharacterized protein n=2 Tax=Pseudoalteromonas luteoviolacea TaxID=43657 RepID=A0A167NHW1_9GAMM|nr:hypothetical protein [Pseudoalteromonas luteoviolacea]KZN50019.1 hypothetical protein N476_16870 [Pseudoalteromonas luteoviolacea H33]KZN68311.1 hypothetical protein N473_07760 [Pseudoalteromonas luteoviolacea CPMOR-1]KZN76407.1 hypothetical protein N477_17015 [Pseudoalteromonas luteoviolacea H33-S]